MLQINDTQRLLKKAQRGDSQAFEDLVAPYEKRIYALSYRMLGNREDAEDAAQDALLRIFRALPKYRLEAEFGTWVYRVASSACLDALRKRKIRQSDSLDTLVEAGYAPVSDGESPEESLMRTEKRAALAEGISQLPDDMRAALLLRDVHDRSYEEISKTLDLTMGTVKSRISRARTKLSKILSASPELFQLSNVKRSEGGEKNDL